MEINRNNYEAFLLDLLEGRLSAEDRQRLNDFLLLNPDCAQELLEVEPWVLEKDTVEYRNRDLLKKELPHPTTILTDHNFDLFSIARLEGDLTDEQEQAHQNGIAADPVKAEEWLRWQQTRLVPEHIPFKGKEKLKQGDRSKYRIIWMSLVSAAAAIALLLVLSRPGTELVRTEQAVQSQQITTPQRITTPQQPVENQVTAEAPATDGPATQTQTIEAKTIEVQTPEAQSLETRAPVRVIPAPESVRQEVPGEDLHVRLAAVSPTQLNTFSPAGVPVTDEVTSLDVPLVPVHMRNLSMAQISDMGLMNVIEEYSEEKGFSLWNLASAGVNGINKLSGSDISLMASRDEEGEISGFQLKGKRFSITRPIGQDE